MLKKCADCKNELSIDMFHLHKRAKDGRDSYCKDCKSKQNKKYNAKNKDKIKKHNKEYLCHNRAAHNKRSMKARDKLKKEVLGFYSGGEPKCKWCGETDLNVLSIDHINGDGNCHRKYLYGNNKVGGYRFYLWLKRNNFLEGFQVLCFNDQFRKRSKEMKSDNPTAKQLYHSQYNKSLKLECLKNYGRICECGETDEIVLTLDHVNDDGAKHRRETNLFGSSFYLMLRHNNFPNNPPLKTLCLNCQYKKRAKIALKSNL